ncbi:hypothetical protein CIK05_04835 [Bdellovibrio sp. qaytius]|nr:hypothetical protein CIK05_04835 [Bdellovibrio sp. qaytius]
MNKFFNSKFYFVFWMFVAAFPMKYALDISNEIDHDSQKAIAGIQEQSSMAHASEVEEADLYSNDESQSELANVSDDELLSVLELTPEQYEQSGSPNNPYALSPAQLDLYEDTLRESSGLASGSPIDFMNIAGSEAAVNYEEISACGAGKDKARTNIESVLVKAAKQSTMFANAIAERSQESKHIPRKCITHVMNKFNVGKNSLARCPGGMGTAPLRGGAKPCVTKNLVNLTYNHFTDVAECLNIEEKDLLPKLSNESGMLINTLGSGFDAGVGQLTQPAIEEVNKSYDRYLAEMEKAAIKKPSCLRVMQYKPYLKKAKDVLASRCSFITPPENPLKNIMYMAIYNRVNLDNLLGTRYIAGESFVENDGQLVQLTGTPSDHITGGKFGNNNIQGKFAQLGIKDVNLSNLATMIAFAGYNTGPSTSFNMLNEYLDKRIASKKSLTERDFDFHNPSTATDIDGKVKSVIEIARINVRSANIKKNDPDAKMKLKRVKLLPSKIAKSHLLTFPEFMVYNQNNFDSSILNPKNLAKIQSISNAAEKNKERNKYERFSSIGAPGYLSNLALKDSAIRSAFENSGADQYYCSNPNFLKIRDFKAKPMAAVAPTKEELEPDPVVADPKPAVQPQLKQVKPAAPHKAAPAKKTK